MSPNPVVCAKYMSICSQHKFVNLLIDNNSIANISFALGLEWDSWNKMKSEATQVSQGLGFVLEGAVTPRWASSQQRERVPQVFWIKMQIKMWRWHPESHPKLRLTQQPHSKTSCKWLKCLLLEGLCWSPDLELGIVTWLYQMPLPVWWLHCQTSWPSFSLLLSLFWWHCHCLLPLSWLETILSAAAIWLPCQTITGCDYHHCRSTPGARRIY